MIQIFYMKKEIKKLLLLTKSCGEVKKQFLQLQKSIEPEPEHDAEQQAPTRFVEAEQRERLLVHVGERCSHLPSSPPQLTRSKQGSLWTLHIGHSDWPALENRCADVGWEGRFQKELTQRGGPKKRKWVVVVMA